MRPHLIPVSRLLPAAVILLAAAGCATAVQNTEENDQYLGVPVSEIEGELDTLLHTWYPRIVDTVNGGYWTNFEYDWTPSERQPKFLVTQARGLWTAARAARMFPDDPVFRQAADHGYKFLTDSMWDPQTGGFYQYYPDPAAPPAEPSYKMTYGNSFALFALAEYARINQDPEVLAWVRKAFQWLEDTVHDPVGLGYYNVILPAGMSATDTAGRALIERIGWGEPDWKDQNTSIHLLEAFTTTYQVLPENLVRERLSEMLRLVRDTMVNPGGFLHLYFTTDWQPLDFQDSSREVILENLRYDHKSFGHDIETAYLLIDASQALNGSPDTTTLRIAKKLVDHTLDHGFDENYYGLFNRGYRFAGAPEIEIVDRGKTWWAQAEAWHALALLAAYYPEEPRYPEAFRQMWSYIRNELIDHEHGGWYHTGLDENPEARTAMKAQPWKGAYHDGRALMQVVEYTK